MNDRRGFTLIEIMVALAIVGIMTVIATTNFFSWQNHYSAVDFQREFLSQCSQARTRSMATNLQHRLLIDMTAETVTLQQGNAGTGSSTWTGVAQTVVGSRGAGIARIDNCAVTGPLLAFLFNPDGEVLVQDITAGTTPSPLTQANVRIAATNVADQSTIQIYGWTSKARLINGW